MKSQIKINTYFNKDRIELEEVSEMDGIRTRIVRQVIELKEKSVRDALIALGWLPPKNHGDVK